MSLLISACSPQRAILNAQELSPEEVVLAQDAADEWCEASGECVDIIEFGHSENQIRIMNTKEMEQFGGLGMQGGCVDKEDIIMQPLGDYEDEVGIAPCLTDLSVVWRTIFLHELGHYLQTSRLKSKSHIEVGNIMTTFLNDTSSDCHLTQNDIDYVL